MLNLCSAHYVTPTPPPSFPSTQLICARNVGTLKPPHVLQALPIHSTQFSGNRRHSPVSHMDLAKHEVAETLSRKDTVGVMRLYSSMALNINHRALRPKLISKPSVSPLSSSPSSSSPSLCIAPCPSQCRYGHAEYPSPSHVSSGRAADDGWIAHGHLRFRL